VRGTAPHIGHVRGTAPHIGHVRGTAPRCPTSLRDPPHPTQGPWPTAPHPQHQTQGPWQRLMPSSSGQAVIACPRASARCAVCHTCKPCLGRAGRPCAGRGLLVSPWGEHAPRVRVAHRRGSAAQAASVGATRQGAMGDATRALAIRAHEVVLSQCGPWCRLLCQWQDLIQQTYIASTTHTPLGLHPLGLRVCQACSAGHHSHPTTAWANCEGPTVQGWTAP